MRGSFGSPRINERQGRGAHVDADADVYRGRCSNKAVKPRSVGGLLRGGREATWGYNGCGQVGFARVGH
jgi:hypothetical protein